MLPLVFTTFMQYLKRFATTNRSNISICVTKFWPAQGNGQPCENTPLSYFDYCAKCDCCFSYYVCVCRSQKFASRPLGMGPLPCPCLTPWNTSLHTRVTKPNCRISIRQGVPKFLERHLWDARHGWPLEICPSLICVTLSNLFILGHMAGA